MKYIGYKRAGGTIGVYFYDKNKGVIYCPVVQFSFVKPWTLPHKEERYGNGSWIFGWLFFYFGLIICDGGKNQC